MLGMALFVAAVALSYLMNASLLASAEETKTMIKNAAYILSFPLTLYLIVSTIRGQRDAIVLIDVCIVFGAIAGLFGLAERMTHYNVFFHLTNFIPMLEYNIPPERLLQGDFRSRASHPGADCPPDRLRNDALDAPAARCCPCTIRRRQRRFAYVRALCAGCIGIGIFMALSRTGVIGLIVVGLVTAPGVSGSPTADCHGRLGTGWQSSMRHFPVWSAP